MLQHAVIAHESGLLTWIAPRGIVAAAVSSLFALELQRLGMTQASLLVPLTFVVIIGTVRPERRVRVEGARRACGGH